MSDDQSENSDIESILKSGFFSSADPKELGELIRTTRKNVCLSQGKLLKVMDVSSSTLSRIEAGKGKNSPALNTLEEIAEATGTKLVIGFVPK